MENNIGEKQINLSPEIKEKKVYRVARYTRVSTKEQNIEIQEIAINGYLKMHPDWKLVLFFDEPGMSSAKKRKLYEEMKKNIRAETIDIIIAYKLDRLARSARELLNLLELCKKHRVEMVFVSNNIDTTTSFGKMAFTILSAFAQFERDLITERVNLGLKHIRDSGGKTKSGKPVGRPRKPINDNEIIKLWNQGDRSGKIGKKLGLAKSTIKNRLAGLGYIPKKHKKPKEEDYY